MSGLSWIAAFADVNTGEVVDAWLVWSLKGTGLLVVAWICSRILRRGSAALRHALWASALGGTLLVPMFTRAVPALRLPRGVAALFTNANAVHSGPPASVPVDSLDAKARSRTAEVAVVPTGSPQIREVAWSRSNRTAAIEWIRLVFPVGLFLGVALLLARALAGSFQLWLWARRAQPVEDVSWLSLSHRLAHEAQITRPVTLLRSGAACVPLTWGIVYPTVLLPADASDWNSDRRKAVLLHELAHIKRFDTLTQLLAQISTALFWFNPAVWYAARQMRREREHACDDFVLGAGARASDYANDLLQIARPLVSASVPAAAALAMARPSELEGRLLAILDPRINRRPVSRGRLVLSSAALIGLSIPLAALRSGPVATAPQTAARKQAIAVAPDSSSEKRTAERRNTPVVIVPAVTAPRAPSPASTPLVRRQVEKTPPDLETLIAVARAAAKLSSDYEKGELLRTIAKHYVPDDELRAAYFDAVASMHTDFERARTLEPVLLKDTLLPPAAVAHLVKVATLMTSDNERAGLVIKIASSHPALTPSMRSALIAATTSMTADYSRSRSIIAIAKRDGLSDREAVDLINSAKSMTGSFEKANTLLAIAANHPLSNREVRKAYFSAAETLSSPSDYRRVVVRVID